MSRTTILFGPPGTGKTTTLLNEVEAELNKGTHPERIAFFAFTRKAATEAAARASARFKLKDDDLAWFRTLHSAAFKMLGLSSSEVMQEAHYAELAAHLGRFTFEHSYSEDTERVPLGGALGDLALSVYSRARSRCVSVENEWYETEDNNLNLRDAKLFARTLDDYKRTYQLLDFSDFLDEVHEPLELDLLIIDEAQDLTRQQWDFVRRVGANAKRVIIAGDDDQAIFQWAGADLRTFLGMRGTLKVLPVSYRLPFLVWQKSNNIAKTIKRRQPKDWSPRPDDQGAIQYSEDVDKVPLCGSASWLLLTRLRWQLSMMEQACLDQGVVYQHDGRWSNQTPEIRAVVAYERLRRGEAVTSSQAQFIGRLIPGCANMPTHDSITWDDVSWPFDGKPEWMVALRAMGQEERSYITKLRINKESLTQPGRVVLSTIHGVKGGEADNVVLLPNTSRRIYTAQEQDPDSEARVWYVATSRARHELHVLTATNKYAAAI